MIAFENVTKLYNGIKAVDDFSLKLPEGETLVLLGPSGSGKSTLLRLVNRLIELSAGRILIGDDDIMRTDPIQLRRKIGYAIQHIGLFPHMTVAENIAVVPNLYRWERERIDSRVEHLLATVGLAPEEFAGRYPSQLSGGQKQRVGVARALAVDPPVVLMDEPFGALDPITREQLQNEFLELEFRIKKTIIFVTHDVFEAVRIGDRIALLNEGRLEQVDTPAMLVKSPASGFVDAFLGQHKFQLSLLTRTISSIPRRQAGEGGGSPAEGAARLLTRHSLVEALDAFKEARKRSLPVFEGEEFKGMLDKKALLDEISSILDEQGGA